MASNTQHVPERRARNLFILIFCVLSAGIVLAGSLHYRSHKKQYRAEVEAQLSAIADLKMDELRQYRAQRLGDASIFFDNAAFSSLVRRYFADSQDRDAKDHIREWLNKVKVSGGYDRVRLLDARGVARLSLPPGLPPVNPLISRRSAQILAAGKPDIQDFYRNEQDGRIYLSALAPILDTAKGGRPLGVVVLRIDPADFLYPFIQRWPGPSKTAETLLVRRDGGDALFLNELRFQKDAALNLRIPLTRTENPAVKAVLGQTGIVEGLDYRGGAVLADIHPVPDSPWFMVARIDASEVYGPLRQSFRQLAGFICVLLIGAGLGLFLLWQRQGESFYREQYEAAARLRESEDRFRDLFETSRDALMTLAPPSWAFTAGNPATIAMFRAKDAADFTAHGPWELSPEHQPDGRASADKAREMIETAMRDGSNSFEWTHQRLDGEEFPAEVLLTRLEPDGKAFLHATVRDITERKRAEKALRESEDKYRTLFEASADGILIADIETRMFGHANRAICRMLGYAEEELITLGVTDIHPKDALPSVMAEFEAQARGDKTLASNLPCLRKDGTIFYADVNVSRLTIDGRACNIGIFRDITERKRNEQKIERLNRLLRAIRNVNQLITREKDPDRLIQDICMLLVKDRGYSSVMLILTDAAGLPRLHAAEGFGEAFQPLAESLRQGVLPPCCAEARSHEGAYRVTDRARVCAPCPLAAHSPQNAIMCISLRHEGALHGYLTVATESSPQIDAEDQSLLTEVAGDVAFALHGIGQEAAMRQSEVKIGVVEGQFRQSQRMEVVGRLAGGVAHDFNNLLTAILGNCTFLLADIPKDDPRHADVEEIRKAGERAANLTRQLLAFSRKQVLQLRALNINAVLTDMEKLLRRLIGEDVSLTASIAEDLALVKADPGQMEQVVMNLAVNARDAMAKGGQLTIETRNIEVSAPQLLAHDAALPPGRYVLLTASDTGSGMDAGTLEHIFEPFFTTKELGKGTGLGLSTVYGIVKQSNGFIDVQSELGRGATFKIFLPAVSDASLEREREGEGEKKTAGGKEPLHHPVGRRRRHRASGSMPDTHGCGVCGLGSGIRAGGPGSCG